MSRYAVNSLLYRLKKDPEFRARFIKDPATWTSPTPSARPSSPGIYGR